MTSQVLKHWVIIPATGKGSRMQADRPKQYLMLGKQTILQYTLDKLLSYPKIDGVVLVLHAQDEYWPTLGYHSEKPLLLCQGGEQRQHSVFNGLQCLKQHGEDNPLVLIHDAVRPFVSHAELDRLIEVAVADEAGALLAAPVADTLKLANDRGKVEHTQGREHLWRALTPQAFRLDAVYRALQHAIASATQITDDASAMELAGYHPALVASSTINFKITTVDDLTLARYIIRYTKD